MTESVLNTTTDAVFIPTIIAQKALGRLGAYLSIGKNVTKDNELTTATFGQTIRTPIRGAVTAKDKTAGDVFTKQNPTATDVYVTLNKHKEVTITLDDVTKILDNQDTQAGYGDDAAIAIAEAIETDLLALHTSIANTRTWDRTSADTIDASLLAIRKFFTDQKVPKLEQKFLAVDASIMNDLLKQEKYTNQSWRGQQNSVAEGTMVRTYGFDIEESQLIPVSGSPVCYHNIAYTRGGLVLASRPLPKPVGFGGNYAVISDPGVGISLRTLFWYNADLGAHQLTLDVLYGVAILDTRKILEVESF